MLVLFMDVVCKKLVEGLCANSKDRRKMKIQKERQ